MSVFSALKYVTKPQLLQDKVKQLCTADNAKSVVSMLTASTALGLVGMAFHSVMSDPKPVTAPWLWAAHHHGELWQEYCKLRRTLRPQLRVVLDSTVRRSLEWLMVMQVSPPEHFHANTVATATRRLRVAEDGLLTAVGASGIPWSVRTQASLAGSQRRVALPAHERPAQAVNSLRSALEIMYRNVVQLSRVNMVTNAVRQRYQPAHHGAHPPAPSRADRLRGTAPAQGAAVPSAAFVPTAVPTKPWHTGHNAARAAQDGARRVRDARTKQEYVAAKANARIMRRLQQARTAQMA